MHYHRDPPGVIRIHLDVLEGPELYPGGIVSISSDEFLTPVRFCFKETSGDLDTVLEFLIEALVLVFILR